MWRLAVFSEKLAQRNIHTTEVTRAERAFAEFREEAARRDVVPGWLR
jgi:hypothetical protein